MKVSAAAPVNSIYALHEALLMLHDEGIENAWARHRRHHEALVAGLEAMGLRMAVDPAWRLPQLNAVVVPEGLDETRARRQLLDDHDVEIGAGLGALAGKVWRIGLMGYASPVVRRPWRRRSRPADPQGARTPRARCRASPRSTANRRSSRAGS